MMKRRVCGAARVRSRSYGSWTMSKTVVVVVAVVVDVVVVAVVGVGCIRSLCLQKWQCDLKEVIGKQYIHKELEQTDQRKGTDQITKM